MSPSTAPPIEIEGATPSSQLRRQLADEGRPVLVAFSRGKDSIAAWLALRDAGVQVVPYHLYLIPDLEWVNASLAYFEDWFGQRIWNLPHPSLIRWITNAVYQPPERLRVIEAMDLREPEYQEVNALIMEAEGLPPDTWTCDGVRAADSPNRRSSIVTHGPVNLVKRQQKVVWDWRKAHVMSKIDQAGVKLPSDYEWFGRSFDGIDRRFLDPLKARAPRDYARVIEWFPLAEMDQRRAHL
jgi:hypothetical protein